MLGDVHPSAATGSAEGNCCKDATALGRHVSSAQGSFRRLEIAEISETGKSKVEVADEKASVAEEDERSFYCVKLPITGSPREFQHYLQSPRRTVQMYWSLCVEKSTSRKIQRAHTCSEDGSFQILPLDLWKICTSFTCKGNSGIDVRVPSTVHPAQKLKTRSER